MPAVAEKKTGRQVYIGRSEPVSGPAWRASAAGRSVRRVAAQVAGSRSDKQGPADPGEVFSATPVCG